MGECGIPPIPPNFTRIRIVALCNTSVESAHRSIALHGLPESTKAYNNIDDLANDPDVDMIIISVVVTKHLELAKPALLRNKKILVEWPLGTSVQEAEELTQLAKSNGLDTAVGLQARSDRLILKLKEMIDGGEIGEITSTSVSGSFAPLTIGGWFEGGEYFLDMKNGGNKFHIFFGHFLDSFIHVLGDFDLDTISAILKNDSSSVPLLNANFTKVVNPAYPKNTPDQVLVQGVLKRGAVTSIVYRESDKAVDAIGVCWLINGTKGEIEVLMDESQWQMNSPNRTLKIRLSKGEAKEVDFRNVELSSATGIPDISLNTALVLHAFAEGDKTRYADFETALNTHRLLARIVEKSGYKH